MRTETGPLKLGDDWTGYFIRGDNALGMAGVLQAIANSIEYGDQCVAASAPGYLRRLAKELERVTEDRD